MCVKMREIPLFRANVLQRVQAIRIVRLFRMDPVRPYRQPPMKPIARSRVLPGHVILRQAIVKTVGQLRFRVFVLRGVEVMPIAMTV